MSEEKNQNEIEEVTNEDEHKDVEHYCYLCRRPESVAGKMLELPNNIFYMYRLYAEDIKFYGQWSVWIY